MFVFSLSHIFILTADCRGTLVSELWLIKWVPPRVPAFASTADYSARQVITEMNHLRLK